MNPRLLSSIGGWMGALLALGLGLLGGCQSASMGTLDPLSDADQRLLQSYLLELKARYRLIDTIRSYMKVQVQTPEGTQEVREILRYAYPDKLRVDVLGAFTETRAVILAVEGQFTLYLVQENEAIQDVLSDQVLTDVFGVDLRISDVRSALFANPFLEGETRNLRGVRSDGRFRVQRRSTRPGHWEEITLEVREDRPLVLSWRLFSADDQLVQETIFQDYREVAGLMVPFKTVVFRPQQQTRVIFQLSQPELHVPFGPNTFRLNLENARIRKVAS